MGMNLKDYAMVFASGGLSLGLGGGLSSAISKAFKSDIFKPAQEPQLVTEQDPVILAAQQDERKRQRNMNGRSSTILSPLVSSSTNQFKTTLGGA